MDYQKAYENKVGSAFLNVKKAVAGTKANIKLTYKVGSLGIDDSGSMKVLFRIVSDCGQPQFEDSKKENFLKISTTNEKVQATVSANSSGMFGKVHERPWSKGFVVNFSNDSLAEGDEVYFDFKNWRAQTFCEKTFEFKILVDPFATGRFIELSHSPTMEIVPDIPSKLVILTPSLLEKGEDFKFLVKLEDVWGNPCTNLDGNFVFQENKQLELPKKVGFRKGKALVSARVKQGNVNYIGGEYKNLKAKSNPIKTTENPKLRYFWADLHGQSEETVGTNDINDYFSFAKDYAYLDVAGHQANDFQVSKTFWQGINKATKKYTKKGKFVAFPGYEWSGNTPNGGDRNVIYLKEGGGIFRSSHALINDFSDLESDTINVNELFKKLPEKGAMTLAHVGGRYSNLDMHNQTFERSIEIHSDWGTFEWFFLDALAKGYKVGVVAGSDGHDGRLGASYPGLGHFHTYGGLTCILSPELSRKKVFESIFKRHTYATTGARIFLDVVCEENGKLLGIMGDEVRVGKNPVIKVNALGTKPIDRIEVYDKQSVLKVFYPVLTNTKAKAVQILWSGAKVKGRKRSFPWQGKIAVSGNSIDKIERINCFNTSFIAQNKNEFTLDGVTTGGVQGVTLYLGSNSGVIEGLINEKRINIEIKSIAQTPKEFDMSGLDAKIQIYQTSVSDDPNEMEVSLPLKELGRGTYPIFVKVVQKDGHMAWSSPIFLRN